MTFKERAISALQSISVQHGKPWLINSKDQHEISIREAIDAIESLPERDPNPEPRKYLIRYKYDSNRNSRRHTGDADAVYTINDGKEFSEADIEEFREWAKTRHEWCDHVVIGTIFELAS